MKVFIVYCHPSKNSFTYEVKEAFIKGLESAGHSYEISDLYADGFNPVMSEKEYDFIIWIVLYRRTFFLSRKR